MLGGIFAWANCAQQFIRRSKGRVIVRFVGAEFIPGLSNFYPEAFFFTLFFTGGGGPDTGKFPPPVIVLGVLDWP